MLKPIDPDRTVQYVPQCERGDDGEPIPNATVFELRPLTHYEQAYIDNAASLTTVDPDGTQHVAIQAGTMQTLRVRCGLVGVRGYPLTPTFVTDKCSKRKVVDLAFLETLPRDVFVELSHEVQRISGVDEGEAAPSSPSSGGAPRMDSPTAAEPAIYSPPASA